MCTLSNFDPTKVFNAKTVVYNYTEHEFSLNTSILACLLAYLLIIITTTVLLLLLLLLWL
jgi:hypothetical protein